MPQTVKVIAARAAAGAAVVLLTLVAGPGSEGAKPTDRVLFEGEEPAVSPDGKQVAFRRWVGNNSEIFLAPLDGSGSPRNITNNPAMERSPAWSPDGKWLCIVSNRSGNKDLWILAVAAADADPASIPPPRQLTEASTPDEDPAWSPDGKQIAYVGRDGGRTEIFTVPPGGGEPVRITNSDDEEARPAWSGDGRRLVFSADRLDANNIWMIEFGRTGDTPGGIGDRTASGAPFGIYQLTEGDFDDTDPAWCPGGDVIAFSSNRRSEIGVHTGEAMLGDVSSDHYGSGLVRAPRPDDPRRIYTVSPGPRPILTTLVDTQKVAEWPAWAPNGHDLVYVVSPRQRPEGAGGVGYSSPGDKPEIHVREGARSR